MIQIHPWIDALEGQFSALRLLDQTLSTPQSRQILEREGILTASLTNARDLRRAACYAWAPEPTRAVWEASQSIPDDAKLVPEMFQGPALWWYFEEPLPVATTSYHPAVKALLISSVFPNSVALFCHVEDLTHEFFGGLIPTQSCAGPWGKTLQDFIGLCQQDYDRRYREYVYPKGLMGRDTTLAATRMLCRFLVAGCAWLQQKILVSTPGPVGRPWRRRIAREHPEAAPITDVQVVSLRRVQRERPGTFDDAPTVEWSCQWVVTGHWRNQFYPASRKHQLVWIMPFLKGPVDKPLKTPIHTVYSVQR